MIDSPTLNLQRTRMKWIKRDLFELLAEWIPHIELEEDVPYRRSTWLLNERDVFYLGDLVACSRADLLKITGMTEKTVDVIERRLAAYDLALGQPCSAWTAYKEGCIRDGRAMDFSGPEWDVAVAYPRGRADAGHSHTTASPPRNSVPRFGSRGRRPGP